MLHPHVPRILEVPSGNRPFREGHAVGTQDYICLSTGWASSAYGPQATLFNDDNDQIITHFLSRNPDGQTRPGLPGRTPVTRAPSGATRFRVLPIPLIRPPFLGFYLRWSELRRDPPTATG